MFVHSTDFFNELERSVMDTNHDVISAAGFLHGETEFSFSTCIAWACDILMRKEDVISKKRFELKLVSNL